ncbi:unnamed protein product [Ranitomeya imitator]|uniref:Uncharacterized protein n=1 Tax=Ranitomeya imitator TaxID=111125 RepID=A0ABN9LC26_9NEOB|nr:unnamed protein product [Ranitomeya imitator]
MSTHDAASNPRAAWDPSPSGWEFGGPESGTGIRKLEKGQVDKQGNLFDFLRPDRLARVQANPSDHCSCAILMLRHGWRTGAIVPELESRNQIVNTEQYSQSLTRMQALTGLLSACSPELSFFLWTLVEGAFYLYIYAVTKEPIYPPVWQHPSAHLPQPHGLSPAAICRFSDVYMSSITAPSTTKTLNYTFFPRRHPLQHEAPLWMDQLCTGCMKTALLENAHIR